MDKNTIINSLCSYLSGTREFLVLSQTMTEIQKNPQINSLIKNFNEKQSALQSQRLSQKQIEKLIDEISFEYEKLMEIPLVNAYFNKTEQFNQLLSQIMIAVNNNLEKMLQNK